MMELCGFCYGCSLLYRTALYWNVFPLFCPPTCSLKPGLSRVFQSAKTKTRSLNFLTQKDEVSFHRLLIENIPDVWNPAMKYSRMCDVKPPPVWLFTDAFLKYRSTSGRSSAGRALQGQRRAPFTQTEEGRRLFPETSTSSDSAQLLGLFALLCLGTNEINRVCQTS